MVIEAFVLNADHRSQGIHRDVPDFQIIRFFPAFERGNNGLIRSVDDACLISPERIRPRHAHQPVRLTRKLLNLLRISPEIIPGQPRGHGKKQDKMQFYDKSQKTIPLFLLFSSHTRPPAFPLSPSYVTLFHTLIRSRITSPARRSPATGGTKATLPGALFPFAAGMAAFSC